MRNADSFQSTLYDMKCHLVLSHWRPMQWPQTQTELLRLFDSWLFLITLTVFRLGHNPILLSLKRTLMVSYFSRFHFQYVTCRIANKIEWSKLHLLHKPHPSCVAVCAYGAPLNKMSNNCNNLYLACILIQWLDILIQNKLQQKQHHWRLGGKSARRCLKTSYFSILQHPQSTY